MLLHLLILLLFLGLLILNNIGFVFLFIILLLIFLLNLIPLSLLLLILLLFLGLLILNNIGFVFLFIILLLIFLLNLIPLSLLLLVYPFCNYFVLLHDPSLPPVPSPKPSRRRRSRRHQLLLRPHISYLLHTYSPFPPSISLNISTSHSSSQHQLPFLPLYSSALVCSSSSLLSSFINIPYLLLPLLFITIFFSLVIYLSPYPPFSLSSSLLCLSSSF